MTRLGFDLSVFAVAALSCACSPGEVATSVAGLSPQLPHAPRSGPWFEGWYTRVTDESLGVSFAVVVGSHVPRGARPAMGAPLPGYAGVLIHEGAGAPLESHAFLVSESRVESASDSPDVDDFSWESDGVGRFSSAEIALDVPDRLRVSVALGARRPWNAAAPDLGPEGVLGRLPGPLHWYVHSLGSPAIYRLEREVAGTWRVLEGTGTAHLEKNWGRQFPNAWIWAQGVAGAGAEDAAFVMTGGRLEGLPDFVEPWMLGFRSGPIAWDFSSAAPGTHVSRTLDPCAGHVTLTIRDPHRTLVVEATARPETFGPVAVPTADGFREAGAAESFATSVVISAYRHHAIGGLFGREVLVAEQSFEGAALEFGGAFQCAHPLEFTGWR